MIKHPVSIFASEASKKALTEGHSHAGKEGGHQGRPAGPLRPENPVGTAEDVLLKESPKYKQTSVM